jgi:protoporphyrinogen oxidase
VVNRLRDAYPILEAGYQDKVDKIGNYLRRFSNLRSCGRNGEFEYLWIHDMMLTGERVVKKCIAGA